MPRSARFPRVLSFAALLKPRGLGGLYLQTLERIMFRKILIANRGEVDSHHVAPFLDVNVA